MVKIVATGDLMLGENSLYWGIGSRSIFEKKKIDFFQYTSHLFKNADIFLGNLECMLSSKTYGLVDDNTFIASEDVVPQLKQSGINIMNIANNHMLDRGPELFDETVDILKKNNISHIGSYHQEPLIVECNGMSLCFMGMSVRPEQSYESCMKYERDAEYVISEAARLKNLADYLILSIHWGEEYLDYPDPIQVDLAHRLCDAGVDVIAGHHSHIFQGVERYGNSVIFYGLGNFISDMCQKKSKKGYAADLVLTGNKNIDYKLHYYEINRNYQPVLIENNKSVNELIIKNLNNQNYLQDITDTIKLFRREYRIFLLLNFYRYPLIKLFMIIFQAVLRKLKIR